MKLKSLYDMVQGQQVPEMTKEQATFFIEMCLVDAKDPDWELPLGLPFLLQVLVKRLEVFGIKNKFSSPVLIFTAYLCDRPGFSVMWAYTLAHLLELNKGNRITMKEFGIFFANGFPTQDMYMDCWDAQKGHNHGVAADNLMDNSDWWKS